VDRQSTFLLALGMLILAAGVVSVVGWIQFARERRSARSGTLHEHGSEGSLDGGEPVGQTEPR
jgi:hypothetical protein